MGNINSSLIKTQSSTMNCDNDEDAIMEQIKATWKLEEQKTVEKKSNQMNDNENKQSTVIEDESKIFNDLQNDLSIQNIISALKYYQSIQNDDNYNNLISQYFQETNKTILQDYTSILKTYLNNTIEHNHIVFEQIYNIMSKQIQCDIKNCKQYSRNNRDRAKESVKSNNDKNNQFKAIFYTDLLDTIHCYFMHSYDIGFRMKYSELKDIYNASQQR
eukprot:331668_1